MSILTDVTKCIGCDKCVKACQEVNKLPAEKPWRWLSSISDLSSARWTTVMRLHGDDGDRFVRKQCRHCLEPACVEACPEGAMLFGDLNDPNSKVREVLAASYVLRRKPELGTGPNVYYLV